MATINHKVKILNEDKTRYDTYHVETNVGQVYDFSKSKWLNEIIEDLENELLNVTGGINVTELNDNLTLTMQDLDSVETLVDAIQTELAKKYVKPETGITLEDLSESVRLALANADKFETIEAELNQIRVDLKSYVDEEIEKITMSMKITTEEFIATANQTVFTLVNDGNLKTDNIRVKVGGVEQVTPENFTKNTNDNGVTTLTFLEPIPEGAVVTISYYGGIDSFNAVLESHTSNVNIHITEEEKSHIDNMYKTLNNGGRLSTQGKEVFDWNEIKENGFYFSDSSKAVNSPRNLEGDWFFGIVMAEDSEWVVQKLIQYSNNDTLEYMRACRNGVWYDWENTTVANDNYYKAEKSFGSFIFDNSETSEYVRLLIPKDISFWGMLEINITSVYQFSNVEGGAKILLHLGIDDYLINEYTQEIHNISSGFADNFYIKNLEELDNFFAIEIVKRQFKNPIALTLTAYGGVDGSTPSSLVESITFEKGLYNSILELPIQTSKYQSLINDVKDTVTTTQITLHDLGVGFDEHLNDEDIHVTVTDKERWNNKTNDSKIASATELGHVKVGDNLTIDAEGKLNASGGNTGVMQLYEGIADELLMPGTYYVTGSNLVTRGFPLNLGAGRGLLEVFSDNIDVVHQRFSFNGYGYIRSKSTNNNWSAWSAFSNANGDMIQRVSLTLENGCTGSASARKTMAGQVEVECFVTFPSNFSITSIIATLPVEMRPKSSSIIPLVRSSDSNIAGHWVYSQSNGTIRLGNGTTLPPAGVGYKFTGVFY